MQNFPHDVSSLKAALSAMPVGVSWASVADQTILFMNRKFSEIFGYTLGDFKDISEWVEKTYPFAEDRELVARTWGAYFAAPVASEYSIEPMEIRVLCSNGSIKTVLHSGVILPDAGWALATFVDITNRKRDELLIRAAERKAAESQSIYKLLLDHSPEMIVLSPFDESERYVSAAVEQITGFTTEEYLALQRSESVHPDDYEEVSWIIQELKAGKLRHLLRYRVLQKGGSYCWVEAIITGYLNPMSQQTAGYVATVRDISDQKRREERLTTEFRELAQVASLDEVTGIANRRAFNRAINSEARRHGRSTKDVSLLMVDVDYFKGYNDLYGHLPGDVCLRNIATALKASVRREADSVARFGGEEFVLLLPTTDMMGAERIAEHVLRAVEVMAIPHEGSPYGIVTVSIGIASWPAGEVMDHNQLLARADRALYQAKHGGRNRFMVG